MVVSVVAIPKKELACMHAAARSSVFGIVQLNFAHSQPVLLKWSSHHHVVMHNAV